MRVRSPSRFLLNKFFVEILDPPNEGRTIWQETSILTCYQRNLKLNSTATLNSISIHPIPLYNIITNRITTILLASVVILVHLIDSCTRKEEQERQDLANLNNELAVIHEMNKRSSTEGAPETFDYCMSRCMSSIQSAKSHDKICPFTNYRLSDDFRSFCLNAGLEGSKFVINPHIVAHTELFLKALELCPSSISLGIVLHGTKTKENVVNILENGLDPSKRKRQAHGPGEYFSKCPGGGLLHLLLRLTSCWCSWLLCHNGPRKRRNQGTIVSL